MDLLITIDTEGDDAWRTPGFETKNARAIPRFHQLCVKHGFKPTYLVTTEMAGDDGFVEVARDALGRGECEIGAHPHAWTSPPEHAVTSDDLRHRPYLIEYPPAVMRDKLERLTGLLAERFGVRPRSHRAGRWAFNTAYARMLADLGYVVDTSVVPHARDLLIQERPAADRVRVPLPDYSTFPDRPYFVDGLPLLELPMTTVPGYPRLLREIYKRIPSRIVKRVIHKLRGQPVLWFRPGRKNGIAMRAVAERRIRDRAPYVMFMLHSSELMAGTNPTFRTERDIDELYDTLEGVFAWLRGRGLRGATLSDFHAGFAA